MLSKKVKKYDADVVIAGGGPGGCTVAKELAKKGKRVILLEKGGNDTHFFGNQLGIYLKLEKGLRLPLPVRGTEEGYNLILGQGVGGGTLVYAGSAFLPDVEFWKECGVDMPQDLIDEAAKETWHNIPPDEFIGQGTRRVWDAARELGMPFDKAARHVDFEKCKVGCEKCVMGCPKSAKWTARTFAQEALGHGLTLLTHTKVNDVMIENGVAGGVRAMGRRGQRYEINAKVTVCSAGGVGTPIILKNSGFAEAGSWFCGDPTVFAFGFVKEGRGNMGEHSMTIGWHDHEHGCLICSMVQPQIAWQLMYMQDEPFKGFRQMHRYRKALGMFTKVSDEGVGRIGLDGKVSKTFTERDWKRLEYGRVTMQRILTKAGCDPYDFHHGTMTLGHPSSSVRVGELLDTNLETSVKNLYVCDNSTAPGAPGQPPALTVVVLGKMLARRLETIV